MKFIHISDIHLSDKLDFDSSNSKLIRKIKWNSFEKILKENRDKDFLLISGDLFERDFFTLRDYQKLFEIIKDFSKDVYYLSGNHDYIDGKNEIFFSDKPDNLYIFSSDRIEFFEHNYVRIYGISYKDRIFDKRFNYNISLNHDYYNILIGHGVFNENNSAYMDLNLERISNIGFDYVGLGHIHKKQKFSDKIFYVGSIEPMSFKDKGEFGYNLIDENGVKFINSSQMSFNTFDFDLNDFKRSEDFEKFLEKKLVKKYNFFTINVSNYDKFNISEKYLKDSLDLAYLKINYLRNQNYYKDLSKIYESTILGDFYQYFVDLDMDDPVNKRALEIGFDAILRSKDE